MSGPSDPQRIADWLEPVYRPSTEDDPVRRDYANERPSCERCGGSGWVEDDAPTPDLPAPGTVSRCPECHEVRGEGS